MPSVAGSQALKAELPARFLRVLEALGLTVDGLLRKGVPTDLLLSEDYQRTFEPFLWQIGDLSYLLKPGAQTDVYHFTLDWKAENPKKSGPLVWNCHRGMGKSHLGLMVLISRCLRDPGHIARFASPTTKQTGEIIAQPLKTILDECPPPLYPEKKYDKYYFRNPTWENKNAVSVLHLCGCKEMAGALRGPRSDTIFVDEGREVDNLPYIVKSVFGPHFVTREEHDPLMVLSSTPPDYGTHPYWTEFTDPARNAGRYIRRNVDENPDFTKADRVALLELCGGEDTTDWRREALCLRVSCEDRMVIPEFASNKEGEAIKAATIVEEWPRPKYFWPHMGADFGWMDNSALLWGYIDWPQGDQKDKHLVIEDEFVVHYKTPGEIATGIKAIEERLYHDVAYKDSLGRPIIRRYADNDALALACLRIDHGIQISAADKWDPESAIAELRTKLREGKIRILKRCKYLLNQLENGLLDKRGKIERSEDQMIGHCDAIMALVYLNRMIKWNDCPVPRTLITDPNVWVNRQPMGVGHSPVRVTREPLFIMNRAVVQ